jgi:hypothetical protein
MPLDTISPPGNEHIVRRVPQERLRQAGISSQIFALDVNRSNIRTPARERAVPVRTV